MPQLLLESDLDSFDLDSVLLTGKGINALSGATGFGLPPVAGQWLEGAGDGATYRGSRTLPRDIDLPILIDGGDRETLQALASRFSRIVSGPCRLRFVEDDGTDWSLTVVRVGGGDYIYGEDTIGSRDLLTVITLRAGDPYWVSSVTSMKTITGESSAAGLLPKLMSLQLSSSQAIGQIEMENTGDASAYPVWQITGPCGEFTATSPTGEVLNWDGVLGSGDVLTIDTKTGLVTDQTGANRYADIGPAPRFWSIPPGLTTANVVLGGTPTSASRVTCTWRPRKWMVV